jgi:uncharacterized protein (TIGR03083 family)
MDQAEWTVIERERLRLADLLAGLSEEQWEAPSLCVQWRVRDVAAHVAMTPTGPPMSALLSRTLLARGRLWDAAAQLAREHARRPTQAIVTELRQGAAARSMPRLTTPENLFMDVLVHSQDIAIPLGLEHPMPEMAARIAFLHVWAMGWPFHAKRRLRGVRLVATDVDLGVGQGPTVEGTVADLLLLATGRTSGVTRRLHGPGTSRIPA